MNDILKDLGRFAAKKGREKLKEIGRDIILSKDTVSLRDDIEHGNEVGDFVVADGRFAMVGRKKTKDSSGIIVLLKTPLKKWHYQMSYNPYAKLVCDDGGCNFKTGAISPTDGNSNTNLVKQKQNELYEVMCNPYRCPHDYYFPLFDFQKKYGDQWYVPAISELSEIFSNTDTWNRFKELLTKAGKTIDSSLSQNVRLWSSTESSDCGSLTGSLADCLSICENQQPKIESTLKGVECFAILCKCF